MRKNINHTQIYRVTKLRNQIIIKAQKKIRMEPIDFEIVSFLEQKKNIRNPPFCLTCQLKPKQIWNLTESEPRTSKEQRNKDRTSWSGKKQVLEKTKFWAFFCHYLRDATLHHVFFSAKKILKDNVFFYPKRICLTLHSWSNAKLSQNHVVAIVFNLILKNAGKLVNVGYHRQNEKHKNGSWQNWKQFNLSNMPRF